MPINDNPRGLVSTRTTAGYTALMALLGAGVFVAPALSALNWAAIGLLSAGAVVLGARRYAPRRRSAWWLLSGAILAMTAGDVVYGLTGAHRQVASPPLADVCYLAMFPLVMTGLMQMTRASSVVLADRSRSLDLLTFTCGATLVAWVVLVSPGLRIPGLGYADKSTMAAYALGDLLLLIFSVRLLVAARGSWAVLLLAVGAAGVLASDVAYDLAEVGGGWQPGGPAELGYLVFYFGWGAAALQPSMVNLTAPSDARLTRLRGRWTVLLGLSLAIAPGTLLVESLAGSPRDGVVITVAMAIVSALVITRLVDAIRKHQRAVDRERVLREACGELVAATDPGDVRTALRAAVARLMPSGVEHRVVVLINDAGDPAAAHPLPPADGDRRTRPLATRMLGPDLREELHKFATALVCPLILRRRSAADPGDGTLLVAAHDQALAAMQDAVEVLAAQAALALERIALTDAVNRRDSDRYLRTVVQNTVDVVLVTDDDDRIRYASPSLATLLGVAPPAFATLCDILHPDDHPQVVRTAQAARHSHDLDGAQDCWNLRRPDGRRVLVDVSYRDLRQDRMVRGFVITMQDVTERRRHQQELALRALLASPGNQNRRSVLNKFR
jgi:PAS domain S-box-containing protein